ncbi:hypothetical protein R1sor_009308 [Riccia sorocarpa]|uniref:CCHC-type domain-containing protein n=1 Tax=Riccia sorocarpa TaxID=122646 RepID=A0ABD3HY99_9MARC
MVPAHRLRNRKTFPFLSSVAPGRDEGGQSSARTELIKEVATKKQGHQALISAEEDFDEGESRRSLAPRRTVDCEEEARIKNFEEHREETEALQRDEETSRITSVEEAITTKGPRLKQLALKAPLHGVVFWVSTRKFVSGFEELASCSEVLQISEDLTEEEVDILEVEEIEGEHEAPKTTQESPEEPESTRETPKDTSKPVRMALQVLPPGILNFQGVEDFNSFVNMFENVYTARNIDADDDKACQIGQCFVGSAQAWYNRLPANVWADYQQLIIAGTFAQTEEKDLPLPDPMYIIPGYKGQMMLNPYAGTGQEQGYLPLMQMLQPSMLPTMHAAVPMVQRPMQVALVVDQAPPPVATTSTLDQIMVKLEKLQLAQEDLTRRTVNTAAHGEISCTRCRGIGHTNMECPNPDIENRCDHCGRNNHTTQNCRYRQDMPIHVVQTEAQQAGAQQYNQHLVDPAPRNRGPSRDGSQDFPQFRAVLQELQRPQAPANNGGNQNTHLIMVEVESDQEEEVHQIDQISIGDLMLTTRARAYTDGSPNPEVISSSADEQEVPRRPNQEEVGVDNPTLNMNMQPNLFPGALPTSGDVQPESTQEGIDVLPVPMPHVPPSQHARSTDPAMVNGRFTELLRTQTSPVEGSMHPTTERNS